MPTAAWTSLSPYARLERACHVDYVSRVRSCGVGVVYPHLGHSSHERVGRDPSLSGNFRHMLSRGKVNYAHIMMVSLSPADGEWEKPDRGFASSVALGLEEKVEDQGDNDPLMVVDKSEVGWAGEEFTGQTEGEAVNIKSNNPGHKADSRKPTKRGEDEVQEVEPFAMVELGESIQNETGEMRKQLEERDTKSIRLKTARASEPNLLFLEERGDPLDKETLVKESTEPSQGQPLSPQESARVETASRKGHHRSRKPTRDSSSNKCSNAYSECKASRDATNPGSMQDSKRVRSTNGLEGLSADEVEERLIEAGVLHRDGAMFDTDELSDEGVYNEVDVPDGSEACRILVDALGCDEADINHLRERYAPLRGEPWYKREPIPGAKVGKKVLDVFFLEETLPELLDLLLGNEEEGGVGLTAEQVRKMMLQTPALVGVEASDASDVVAYLGNDLGLDGKGQLTEALANCPPMLMYNARDNLQQKVQYYLDTLSWSKEDVRSMLAKYPDLLSIKLENGVIGIVEYLRSGIGLQPSMVSDMIQQYPQILEARPKRLKAVVKYLWKVFELPMSDIAVILSQNPRACFLEAEANLAPLRHFFEQELFVEDTARIGYLVYKFPRLLFQDVEIQLKPRAGQFRKAMGLVGVQPLLPRVRSRPKRNNYRVGDTKHNPGGRNRGKRPSSEEGRFRGKEGRWPERRGYGGQSSRNR